MLWAALGEDGAILDPDGRLLLWSSRRRRADGRDDADVYAVEASTVGIARDRR